MSAALAPYFAGTHRLKLLLSCHFVSASSFIVPYLRFQTERESGRPKLSGNHNLDFFLGVGVTSFLIWVVGSGVGYGIALGVPHRFDEALKFILPGYFAGLLVVEMRGWTMPLVCLASLLLAVPASMANSAWGWITTATLIATLGWGIEQWKRRVLS
jgi:predicted branched-subunit amino acid permease